jgi:uncharacterized membrane protein YphA (DoxX/SURF4 family)
MKTTSSFRKMILNTGDDSKMIFIRLIVGLIFLSEGVQKFLIVTAFGPEFFKSMGFTNPMFWVDFTGAFELIGGTLILFGLYTRLASIPLLTIMAIAFIKTKLPLIAIKGFWSFSHEYGTDFSLTLLLITLLIYGGGKWSADLKLMRKNKA